MHRQASGGPGSSMKLYVECGGGSWGLGHSFVQVQPAGGPWREMGPRASLPLAACSAAAGVRLFVACLFFTVGLFSFSFTLRGRAFGRGFMSGFLVGDGDPGYLFFLCGLVMHL